MIINCRLFTVDGQVLCPISVKWIDQGDCSRCGALRRVDACGHFVVCAPELDSLSHTIDVLARAQSAG